MKPLDSQSNISADFIENMDLSNNRFWRPSVSLFATVIVAVSIFVSLLISIGCSGSGTDDSNDHKLHNHNQKNRGLNDYNLILINIDALRADHLGCYGYERDTTPFIDSLAKEGMVFRRAMSNSSFTRESVSVLFSGRLPSSGNSLGWSAAPSRQIKTIGDLYRNAGFKTAFLSNTNVLKGARFTRGFQVIHHTEKWGVSGNGPFLAERAGTFIMENKNHKFMMYLHFLDPHGPYKPPKKIHKRFASPIFPKPISLYRTVRKKCSSLVAEGFGPGDPRFEDMVIRYDAEINHVDRSVKLLFSELERHQLLDHTLVIITADHGEEFLEHGFVEHAWTLHNESLHVPLIFWAPEIFKPRQIPALVSTVDLLPTLLYLQQIPHQRTDFDGSCLFVGKGKNVRFIPPQKPFIAELFIQHRNLLRTVIKDNWKYIAAIKWLEPDERPKALEINVREFERNKHVHLGIWGPVVHEELYDLSRDPLEKRNIIDINKRKELNRILDQYKEDCHKKDLAKAENGINNNSDTNKKPFSKEDEEKLKTLGYL